MLTPQDIESKEFAKAVFGGYDMAAVDEFLEQLVADYSALYKDNMVLKGKLKVLVEKVEEYRSTEDAMRMALLTAQKMSDDMMAETKAKCDEMMAAAARDSDESRAKIADDISHEDMKLEAAKVKTSAFVKASRQILEQYQSFLDKLDTVTAEYGAPAAKEPPHEPVISPEPERVRMPAPAPAETSAELSVDFPHPSASETQEPETPAAETPAPETPAPETPEPEAPAFELPPLDIPEPQDIPSPPEGVDLGDELAPADADMSAATRRIDIDAVRRFYSGSGETKRHAWDEEDEMTTPRPKFDFSDLRFGSNYTDEDVKVRKDKHDK